MKTNFIIADDHQIVSNGIKSIIETKLLGNVVAVVKNGKELLLKLNSCKPNFIILDLNMPEMDGFETATFVADNYPAIKILVVSMREDEHTIGKLKNIGVDGFISKAFEPNEIVNAIEIIQKNGSYFPKKEKSTSSNFNHLTEREIEIIKLISEGFTTKNIADKLFLSTYTIDTHRKNIARKIGANAPISISKYYEEFLKN